MINTVKEFGIEMGRLKQWINHNSKYIIVNNMVVCYLYSAWIFSRAPLVDTMLYINIPNSTYNWLSIGREGAVFSKWLLQNMNFNPYLATSLGYIFACIGGTLMGYICYRCSKRCEVLWTFVPFMFLCPIFAEQFYFKLQILEIGWAYILCASSVALNYFIIFKRKRCLYIFSVIMMIWSFHTYQTFVIIYAEIVGIAYILLCFSTDIREKKTEIIWWAALLEHIMVFIIANGFGQIITSVFFTSSGYLESTISWNTLSADICIRNIIYHLRLIILGDKNNIFFTFFYGIFALLVVILTFKEFLNNKKLHLFVAFMASVGIQFGPILITIYTGSLPSIRGQIVYPLVLVFNGLICYTLVNGTAGKWKRPVEIGIVCMMIIMFWQQVSVTMRLVYTNEVRADEDIRFAQNLDARLIEMDAANKPVAFVGGYDNRLNPTCVRGEMIGQSVFNMFTEIEPHYAVSTWHTCNEMNAMGIPRKQADNTQIEYARRIAINMPIWPARGSVLDVGDYVIVKLAAENWAEEILSTDLTPVDTAWIEYVNDLTVAVDPLEYNGSEVVIRGWCVREGRELTDCILKVFLKHNESGKFYLLESSAVKREELKQFFGSSSQNCGFMAKTDTARLEGALSGYSVYVGYEDNGKIYVKEAGIME